MHCDELFEQMSAALDGELSPAERRELDDHLAQCPQCRELFDELAGHSALLRGLDCAPPEGLSARILSDLPPQKKKAAPVIRLRRWGTLAACAVLALVGAFALSSPFGGTKDDAAVIFRSTAEFAAADAQLAAPAQCEAESCADSAATCAQTAEESEEIRSVSDGDAISDAAPETPAQSAVPDGTSSEQEKTSENAADPSYEIGLNTVGPAEPEDGETTVGFDPSTAPGDINFDPGYTLTPAGPDGSAPCGGALVEVRDVAYLRTGWLGLGEQAPALLTSEEDLAAYLACFPQFSRYLADYNGDFFRTSALIAIVVEAGSGSVTHTVEGVRRDAAGWVVDLAVNVPEAGTCDMAGWLILVETAPVFNPGDRVMLNTIF